MREVLEKFDFDNTITKLDESGLLFKVMEQFKNINLHPDVIDNPTMGTIFEELIRKFNEALNENPGEHFTPRDVVRLMVSLLLAGDEERFTQKGSTLTVYDPCCGTGGMLIIAKEHIFGTPGQAGNNSVAQVFLFGQEVNPETYAVCKSDLFIKDPSGHDADNIAFGSTLSNDGHSSRSFDYIIANPPYGKDWRRDEDHVRAEHERGKSGRFGAGLPRISDGQLLFLQHMLSRMRSPEEGGSRVAIIFNGSPLFTGDAGQGESDIRKWIIENDWLEAIIALPDQLFYNTGISTYIWIITNKKEAHRQGKIQLIDARQFYHKMRKSLGNKRHIIGDGEDGRFDHISLITRVHSDFIHNQKLEFESNGETQTAIVSKIFDNADFGYQKITVQRPLRLNFQTSAERIDRLDSITGFANLARSKKKNQQEKQKEIEAGEELQQKIRAVLQSMDESIVYRDREQFVKALKQAFAQHQVSLKAPQRKAILEALGERDETAAICKDSKGNPEADPELRDTENVPLKEDIDTYFQREVLPHLPDAWIDHSKTRIGYEIPLNRHFYVYQPPRPLEEIEADLKALEQEIAELMGEIK